MGELTIFLQSLGFTKNTIDPNLGVVVIRAQVSKDKIVQNHPVTLVLCVDDLFLMGEEHLIAQTKRELSAEFEIKK
jgi:hypothetical protein